MAFTTSQYIESLQVETLTFIPPNNVPYPPGYVLYINANGTTYWAPGTSASALSTFSTCVYTYIEDNNASMRSSISSLQKQINQQSTALSSLYSNQLELSTTIIFQTSTMFYSSIELTNSTLYSLSSLILFFTNLSATNSSLQFGLSTLSTAIDVQNASTYNAVVGVLNQAIVSTVQYIDKNLSTLSTIVAYERELSTFSTLITRQLLSTSFSLTRITTSTSASLTKSINLLTISTAQNYSTSKGLQTQISSLQTFSTAISSATYLWISSFVSTSQSIQDKYIYASISSLSSVIAYNQISTNAAFQIINAVTLSTTSALNVTNSNVTNLSSQVSTLTNQLSSLTTASLTAGVYNTFVQLGIYTTGLISSLTSSVVVYESTVTSQVYVQNLSISQSYYNKYVSSLYASTLSTLVPFTQIYYSSLTSTSYATVYSTLDSQLNSTVYANTLKYESTLISQLDSTNTIWLSTSVGYSQSQLSSIETSTIVAYTLFINSLNQESTIRGGYFAGASSQGEYAVAIGNMAGSSNQGVYSIAIGNKAATTNQCPSSIVLNASGVAFENSTISGFFVNPLRFDDSVTDAIMHYNVVTKEIIYNNVGSGGSNTNFLSENFILGAGGSNATFVFSLSFDGVRWTQIVGPAQSDCLTIAWNGILWVAGGTNQISYSSDGINWILSGSVDIAAVVVNSCAWNGVLWVAGGQGGILYSYDGINWSLGKGDTFTGQLNAVAWSGSYWLSGGTGSYAVAYSTDGVNWIRVQTPFSACNVLAWNGTLWVGGSDGLYYSYNGLSWVTSGTDIFFGSGNVTSAVWNGTLWVAVGTGILNNVSYSYNGITWLNDAVSPINTNLVTVIWNGIAFLAGSTNPDTTANIQYSYDGISWALNINNFFSGGVTVLASRRVLPEIGKNLFNNNNFQYASSIRIGNSAGALNQGANALAIGTFSGYSSQGAYSIAIGNKAGTLNLAPNSIVLNAGIAPLENSSISGLFVYPIRNDTSGNNGTMQYNIATSEIVYKIPNTTTTFLVAGGSGAHRLAYSYGGVDWIQENDSVFSVACYAIAWNGTLWVAGGSGLNQLVYSMDGINWIPSSSGNSLFTACYAVAWNGTLWVAGGAGGNTVANSTDGIVWTASPSGTSVLTTNCLAAAWNGSYWVLGGTGTYTMASSADGSNWDPIVSGSDYLTTNCTALGWNGVIWIAGGSGIYTMIYSSDAVEWFSNDSGTEILTNTCTAIGWNGLLWVAGGSGLGTIITSADGTSWTNADSVFLTSCTALTWNGRLWVAGGAGDNTVATSADGQSWSASGSGNSILTTACLAIATGPTSQTATNSFSSTIQIGYQSGANNQGNYAIAIGNQAGTVNQNPSSIILNASPFPLENSTLSGLFVNPIRSDMTVGLPVLSYNTNTKEIVYSSKAQNSFSSTIEIGYQAGLIGQGNFAIAIGNQAGKTLQNPSSIILNASPFALENSTLSGLFVNPIRLDNTIHTTLNYNAATKEIVWGYGTNTYSSTIQIGYQAGNVDQGTYAIAIGNQAGTTSQYPSSIILNASPIPLENTTASGFFVSPVRQDNTTNPSLAYNIVTNEIVYGYGLNTYSSTIQIGYQAGLVGQGEYSIAIGNQAATTDQYPGSIVLNANSVPLENSVNPGFYVSPVRTDTTFGNPSLYFNTQTNEIIYGDANIVEGSTIQIGYEAGLFNQGEYSIAIGNKAGRNNQYPGSIVFNASPTVLDAAEPGLFVNPVRLDNTGNANLTYNTTTNEIAYAFGANTYSSTIQIGYAAGLVNPGEYSIAIGNQAGTNNLFPKSIVINADSNVLENTTVAGLFINPIRRDQTAGLAGLAYNTTTKEVVYAYGLNTFSSTIQLGYQAGQNNQGDYAIAIGNLAGTNNQRTRSIIINADSNALQNSTLSGFFVNPIRNDDTYGYPSLVYNSDTKEITASYGILASQSTLAIGLGAGLVSQGEYAIAIGYQAGTLLQSSQSIVINASGTEVNAPTYGLYVAPIRADGTITNVNLLYNTGTKEIVCGNGVNTWGGYIGIGTNAGAVNQGAYSIAIGLEAGTANQHSNSIILNATGGGLENTSNEGLFVAPIREDTTVHPNLLYNTETKEIVYAYGVNTWQDYIGIGSNAGLFSQGINAIAIGSQAGSSNQGTYSVAIGAQAGTSSLGAYSIAIGAYAGTNNLSSQTIVLNASGAPLESVNSGLFINPIRNAPTYGILPLLSYNPSTSEILYSYSQNTFGTQLQIGQNAGASNQGAYAIAIGNNAGTTNQYPSSIIINASATPLENAVSGLFVNPIRLDATPGNPGLAYNPSTKEVVYGYGINTYSSSIQIGYGAGFLNQGQYAIAIGNKAGTANQYPGSIILNANATPLENTTTSGLFVNPIRNDTSIGASGRLHYNSGTSEITYGDESSDQRLKNNIVDADLKQCLSTIEHLPLRYFEWNEEFLHYHNGKDKHELGFVAQEVLSFFPKSVSLYSNSFLPDFHGLNTDQIYKAHIGATKQLMILIQEQQSTIDRLLQYVS